MLLFLFVFIVKVVVAVCHHRDAAAAYLCYWMTITDKKVAVDIASDIEGKYIYFYEISFVSKLVINVIIRFCIRCHYNIYY